MNRYSTEEWDAYEKDMASFPDTQVTEEEANDALETFYAQHRYCTICSEWVLPVNDHGNASSEGEEEFCSTCGEPVRRVK